MFANGDCFRGLCVAAAAGGLLLAGCKGEADIKASQAQRTQGTIDVPAPQAQPKFTFPEAIHSSDASLNAFIIEFARACIAGEYDKYRLYTSRQIKPVAKHQFEKVYRRVQLAEIKGVEALQRISGLPHPLWLIMADIHLHESPEEPVRRAMILVFKEQGQWVMAPAPQALREAVAATRPATTQPGVSPAMPASMPASAPGSAPASGPAVEK